VRSFKKRIQENSWIWLHTAHFALTQCWNTNHTHILVGRMYVCPANSWSAE
jgi:hypothetical protein